MAKWKVDRLVEVREIYTVEAFSEEEAIEIVRDGDYDEYDVEVKETLEDFEAHDAATYDLT